MERLGPLVPRTARLGGIFLALGSFQFVLAMIIVQWKYSGYSDLANYVSDLGGPSSPWSWLFNDSLRLLGALGVAGTFLARRGFPSKTAARLGILFLMVASVFAFLVGSFPESNQGDLEDSIHSTVSSVTFVASALSLTFLGIGTFRDTRWDGYRGYTFLSGLFTFVAIALFEFDPGGSALIGLWERLIIAPVLLWAIVAGAHLVRLPSFAPSQPNA